MRATTQDLVTTLGIKKQSVAERALKESWPYETANGRGDRIYAITQLPADVQKAWVAKHGATPDLLPVLAPEAALEAAARFTGEAQAGFGTHLYNKDTWTPETAISQDVIRDPRVAKWTRIIQEAERPPKEWKRRAWIEALAQKHGTTYQTIYRKLQAYDKKGLAGLHHTKSTRDRPKSWTPEAVDWWVGLCLKREHRKLDSIRLYQALQQEALARSWHIGSYESALWWRRKRVTPQLAALQRGGVRALDNLLPPVLRSYADLAPFEILVGDQHRFDFWVTDEETGEVFRPEGYFWQDLRTRCLYGGALDKKYDSYLMGLALRMGLKIFGAFRQIYTDHGKPEESRYVMGILREMRTLGMEAERTIDAEIQCEDGETVNPCVLIPGTHRKAIVRNAKAKMIESTNRVLEGILRSVFNVPGYVKVLGGSQEENEVDQDEVRRLADSGKLLTYREFFLTVLQAMDYYNSRKPHRGVLKEWAWKPRPGSAVPNDCLKACCVEGWRPQPLSDEAIDLLLLPRAGRQPVVDRGRIHFRSETYEDKREWDGRTNHLINHHKQRVDVRYDPLDPEWILVFRDDRFICRAEPVEISSMKDADLAARKIEEKARRRKGFLLEYRKLTSAVPDILAYSRVYAVEKAAALVGRLKVESSKETAEQYRERTPEEMQAAVAQIEAREEAHGSRLKAQRKKHLPARPGHFLTRVDRYTWCVKFAGAGGDLSEEDTLFKADYEAAMDEGQREYWQTVQQMEGGSV